MKTNDNHITLFNITIFASSGMLMVLEIVAGRLLAPYVGASLYTWTSIIGVVLAGLSLGNWTGGMLADKGHSYYSVGVILVASSVASLMILPLLVLIGNTLQGLEIDLISASFINVLVLFFIPAVLLGILGPLIAALYLKVDNRSGRVLGRVHGLSALGSIAGTFCTGFILIQWMGTRNIVLMVAAILLLLSVPFFRIQAKNFTALFVGFLVFILMLTLAYVTKSLASPCLEESNYYCIRVVNEPDQLGVIKGKSMILDHMMHSTNVKDNPSEVWTPYILAMDALIHDQFSNPASLSYYFAGGGAFTHPRSLRHRYPAADIEVSEIDPLVTEVAQQELYFEAGKVSINHIDARTFLTKRDPASFDVIVTDVFHDIGIPFHLTTHEFSDIVHQRLKPDGIYLINAIDLFPANKLIQSFILTLQQSFEHIAIWVQTPPKESTRMTFVIAASDIPLQSGTRTIEGRDLQQWFEISDFILQQISQYQPEVLTDDFAPVERLMNNLLLTEKGT